MTRIRASDGRWHVDGEWVRSDTGAKLFRVEPGRPVIMVYDKRAQVEIRVHLGDLLHALFDVEITHD